MKLNEVRLNNHQQHFEDLVLFGKEGVEELNDKIDKFLRRFEGQEGELNLSQKVDGAPALFIGHNFPGYPDHFIALKGFTSGANTALTSNEQINSKYGDRPEMAEKLKLGLELAKYIPSGETWQGDCLFSHNDIREEEINGTKYLTFQPNKIVYAFSENNADYDKVKNCDFGIAFHTIYRDAGDGKKSQSFNIDPTRINAPDNFYIMSPAINASKEKTDYNLDELESDYSELKSLESKLLSNEVYEDLINNQVFMKYWNTFENANLADKKQVTLNASTVIKDLSEYVSDKQRNEYEKKVSKLSTDRGRQNAASKYEKDVNELADIINTNKDVIVDMVNVLNKSAEIKMLMWNGLKQAKNDYSTFYKSRTKGYFPAEGEGMAMSDQDGNIVKIVDRTAFSSYNRDPDIMSGFEHESLEIKEGLFNKEWNEISKKDAENLIQIFRDNPKNAWRSRISTKWIGLRYYLSIDELDEIKLKGVDMFGRDRLWVWFAKGDPGYDIASKLWRKLNLMYDVAVDIDMASRHNYESLQEDIDISSISLDNKLEKLLGNSKEKFIKAVIDLILNKTYLDYCTHGLYVENEFPDDAVDANGKNINQKLKKVHDFWLNSFGLDTSQRGVGSKIDSAIYSIKKSISNEDAYKDSLSMDDSNKLPADEKFKIDLFYE